MLYVFAICFTASAGEIFSVGKLDKAVWTQAKSEKDFLLLTVKRRGEVRYSTVATIKVSEILPEQRRLQLTPEKLKRECDRKNDRSSSRIKVISYNSKIAHIKTSTGTMNAVMFRFEALDNGPAKVGLIGLASGAKQKHTMLVKGFFGVTPDGRLIAVNASSRRPVPKKIEEDVLDEFINKIKIH